MKCLLVLFGALGLAASIGNPAEYQNDAQSKGINANSKTNLNATPNTFKPVSSQENYQTRNNLHQNREEYQRFGNNVASRNTQSSHLPTDYSRNINNDNRNVNLENQERFSRNFPSFASNDDVQSQNPFHSSLNQRQELTFGSRPPTQTQMVFSTPIDQDTHRSGRENALDQASVTAVHSQERIQKGTPFPFEYRSDIITGIYENNLEDRFPSIEDQALLAGKVGFRNQNGVKSVQGQQLQGQRSFYQNVDRSDSGFRQQFEQIPSRQDQISSLPESIQNQQKQSNQHQNAIQQSQESSYSTFPRDSFISQGQIAFDSKRISPTISNQPNQQVSADPKEYFPTSRRFENNNSEGRFLSRRIDDNEKPQATRDFNDDAARQNINKDYQQGIGNIHKVGHQDLFQSIRRNNPITTVSQFKQTHPASVIVSGGKTASPVPVMVYQTEGIPSPHAVVIGKDSTELNSASISQHLQTPFAQYSYTHTL